MEELWEGNKISKEITSNSSQLLIQNSAQLQTAIEGEGLPPAMKNSSYLINKGKSYILQLGQMQYYNLFVSSGDINFSRERYGRDPIGNRTNANVPDPVPATPRPQQSRDSDSR